MMHKWHLWRRGESLKTIEGITPLLASWNSNTNPVQIRLQKYLSELAAALQPLPAEPNLFLHMEIDVQNPARLLRHYDLENYLTPVVFRFGAGAFKLVSAQKRVSGGSRISIGIAIGMPAAEMDGWQHLSVTAGSGPQTKLWKARLRESILASKRSPLPPGPAEVHLAWRCAPRRNWVWLWKPTGDAMGPILGEPVARNPFDPDDGRIVALALHLNSDAAAGHSVDVGMWWRRNLGASGLAFEADLLDIVK